MNWTRGVFSGGAVARAMDATSSPALGRVAIVYLAVLPLGQLGVFPIGGAAATVTDLLLLALVLSGMMGILRSVVSPEAEPLPRLDRTTATGFVLLGLFGAWVGLSGVWGFHPMYATAKSLGLVALAAGAYLIAVAGARPRVLVDAWIVGALAVLATTLLFLALGQGGRMLYGGGMIFGFPWSRVRGPFVHPNLLGEYLFVTGVFLWARWPDLKEARAWLWRAVAGATALFLAWTLSTAWLAAGVALVGLALTRRWGGGAARRVALGLAGAALAAVTVVGVVRPVDVQLGTLGIATGGVRPGIWTDALEAFRTAPLVGVGAAPYLAETADPMGGGGTALWDAHSTYLSVLGQFGLVGFALFLGGVAWVALGVAGATAGPRAAEADRSAEGRPLPAAEAEALPRGRAAPLDDADAAGDELEDRTTLARLPFALLLIGAGLLCHWITIAGEDFRHAWAVLGVAGAVAVWRRGRQSRKYDSP